MKYILVDAVHCLISDKGEVFSEMYKLLESYPNKKIALTGANDEEFIKFGLDQLPYEVFTLRHNPEKSSSEYYKIMLMNYKLTKDEVVYFEHNPNAVESAKSLGIVTYYYDNKKKDLDSLKKFLDSNLK